MDWLISGLVLICGYVGWLLYRYESYASRASHEASGKNQALRSKTAIPEGGKVVTLSRGDVFYRIDGAENGGRLVVLVHGYVGCHKDYDIITKQLVEIGKRRVLRMDNYGRGWSSLPFTPGTKVIPALFAGQLAELLFTLNHTEKIDLIGYSMGGGIVAHFADRFPDKVATLGYIAPAGLPSMRHVVRPMLQKLLHVILRFPFGHRLGVWITKRSLGGSSELKWDTDRKEIHDWYASWYTERLENEDALPIAALLTMESYPFAHLEETFASCANHGIPTLAVWGKKDAIVPFSCAIELAAIHKIHANSSLFHEFIFDNAGHMLAVEHGKEVGDAFMSFWTKQH